MSHIQPPPRRRRGCLRPILILLLLAAAGLVLWRTVLVQPFTVPADVTYMSPALEPGVRAVLDRLAYRITAPRRGDIVAVAVSGAPRGFHILRIIALPGETVAAAQGKLLIDGATAAGSYAQGLLPLTLEPRRVPQAHYFVLADDRDVYAARDVPWGPVARRDIIGRVSPAGT